ncbi:MAG TPA: FMN-binding protein [Clostridiales bacterium]|nr:FMN-binding protein [Clostridiales bacterium]
MNNSFKESFAPTVVLVSICLIASILLAATFQITEPLIEKITIEMANAARSTVLPEASGFVEAKDVVLVDGVTEVYEAVNGVGYVITAQFKGFGGPVVVMTGLDPKGNIAGVKVTDASQETPGLGSKATNPDYLNQYVGAHAISSEPGSVDATHISAVTGATYTSRAVFSAISVALQQFSELGGGF